MRIDASLNHHSLRRLVRIYMRTVRKLKFLEVSVIYFSRPADYEGMGRNLP